MNKKHVEPSSEESARGAGFRSLRIEELLREELNSLLDSEVSDPCLEGTRVTSVELDPAVVEKVGAEVERQTGQKVELSSNVDEEILGGIVLQVGNMVLDASIRSRLEKLRKSVAQAA